VVWNVSGGEGGSGGRCSLSGMLGRESEVGAVGVGGGGEGGNGGKSGGLARGEGLCFVHLVDIFCSYSEDRGWRFALR